MTVDHVVPVVRGGSDDATNLATACEACNREKGVTYCEAYLLHCELTGQGSEGVRERLSAALAKPLDMKAALEFLTWLRAQSRTLRQQPMAGQPFPPPSALSAVLNAAGYAPQLVVQRVDGTPMTEADVTPVRALLEAYGDGQEQFTDRELLEGLARFQATPTRPRLRALAARRCQNTGARQDQPHPSLRASTALAETPPGTRRCEPGRFDRDPPRRPRQRHAARGPAPRPRASGGWSPRCWATPYGTRGRALFAGHPPPEPAQGRR
jgi:hypothetical protein